MGKHYSACRIWVFTAVTMKNTVFWDVAPHRYCVNQCRSMHTRQPEATGSMLAWQACLFPTPLCYLLTCPSYLISQTLPHSSLLISHMAHSLPPSVLIQLGGFGWWLSRLPPAHAGSSLADFPTLKMEAIYSSEMSVHTRSTRCHFLEDVVDEAVRSGAACSPVVGVAYCCYSYPHKICTHRIASVSLSSSFPSALPKHNCQSVKVIVYIHSLKQC